MSAVQLELNFKQQLQQAQSAPQDVDWQQLCFAFDAAIADTPLNEQLALAADAICELAEVFALRAEVFLEELRCSSDEEPVLSDDFLADLIVQERPLDLSELLAEPELYVRSPSEKSDVIEGTVVEYQDKAEILAAIEPEIQADELSGEDIALGASHVEDVGAWVSTIREYLEGASGAVLFVDLVKGVRLPMVMVWLGLLLGDFRIEQEGEFYGQSIWVAPSLG